VKSYKLNIAPDEVQEDTGLLLDSFETGIRATSEQDLWEMYDEGNSGGTVTQSSTEAWTGTYSAKAHLNEDRIYMEFYTWHTPLGSGWSYTHQWLLDAGWVQDVYDVMEFYVLVPSALTPSIQLGTYVKGGAIDSWAGAHYYHFYDFQSPGVWEKVILDWHPNHQVGGNYNSTEYLGLRTIDTSGESGSYWTYIDGLTRWYFDDSYGTGGINKDYYFDEFRFKTLPTAERDAVDETYSLHGYYDPATSTTRVGWQQYKFHATHDNYTVKYAFSDIHALGWSNATTAPGAPVCTNGLPGNHDCYYSTTSIDVGSNDTLYIGIKYGTDTSFRQISLPTTQP